MWCGVMWCRVFGGWVQQDVHSAGMASEWGMRAACVVLWVNDRARIQNSGAEPNTPRIT